MSSALGGRAAGSVVALLLIAGCAAAPAKVRDADRAATDRPPAAPTAVAGPGLERFDDAIEGVIREFQIPGAGLALAYKGCLVLARGCGLADVEAGPPAEPTTRFLLASVSSDFTLRQYPAALSCGRGPAPVGSGAHAIRARYRHQNSPAQAAAKE